MDQLVTLYTAQMQTDIATNDINRLKLIRKAPLQDDPTKVAPFVVVGMDTDRGRVMDPIHPREIGGGIRWCNFFKIVGRTPVHRTRDTAYENIGIVNDRALRVVLKNWDLSGLTADNGEIVTHSTPNLIGQNVFKIYGGDNEWYGEFRINLHWFSEETPEMSGIFN